jgi:hypothetical protein
MMIETKKLINDTLNHALALAIGWILDGTIYT